MKKYFDKSVGRMVSLLSSQEAMQITKMYINHCIGKVLMTGARLRMVSYLYDFMTFSNINDINIFVDSLKNEKNIQNLSKEERNCYERIVEFFDSYKNYSNSDDIDIEQASNYIISMEGLKKEIYDKESRNEELEFDEKLLSGLFNNGFEFSSFALHICNLYEEKMKNAIESGTELDIPLEQELAYYNLHDFSSTGDVSKINVKKNEKKEEKIETKVEAPVAIEKKEEQHVEKVEPVVEDKLKEEPPAVEVKVDVPATETNVDSQVKPEVSEVVEENIPSIKINVPEKKDEDIVHQISISIPENEIKDEVKVKEESKHVEEKKEEIPSITVEIPKEEKTKQEMPSENKKEVEKPKVEQQPQSQTKLQPNSIPSKKPFISADDILKATQEINSSDAFGYFGNSIDNRRNSYSGNDDSSFDGTGGFRD